MLVIFCWKLTIGVSTVQSQQTNTMYNPWCSDQLLYMFLLFQKDKNKIYELFSTVGKKHSDNWSILFIPTHNYISDPYGTIPNHKKWYKKCILKKGNCFCHFIEIE